MFNYKKIIFFKSKVIVFIVFLLILGIGLFTYQDYGIGWDEPLKREIGLLNIRYIIGKNNFLLNDMDRYHGPPYEIFLDVTERFLGLTNKPQQIYFMRHLITFLVFFLGLVFFYLLLKSYFKSWSYALLGVIFLTLSPRVFAHSFPNSKDIPFMALFIINIYLLIKFINYKKYLNTLIFGFLGGLLVAIRIFGLMIPLITIFIIILDLCQCKNKQRFKLIISQLIIYLSTLILFTILFWPILWINPLTHLINALVEAKTYFWSNTMLYNGNFLKATNLPWHYLPVWIIITTPPLYLILFIIGILMFLFKFIKSPLKFIKAKHLDMIFLLWLIIPLLIYFILKPAIYDEWRHFLYFYPSLIIFSIIGVKALLDYFKTIKAFSYSKIVPVIAILIIIINLLVILFSMISLHPLENLYFNRLAGKNMPEIKNNFELDYWGLSYRQGLEYLLATDQSTRIAIYGDNYPAEANALILPPQEAKRLMFVDKPEKAKYFITNFRWHPKDYPYQEYFSLIINGTSIMTIYRL